MKLEFSWQLFKKYSNIKLHKDLSSGSQEVPYGQTDRRMDMMTLTVAFCHSANAPKSIKYILQIKKSKQKQWEEYGRGTASWA
jgi:hypothetical protein